VDPLSEILSGVKLNGALFFTADFSAPWGIESPHSSTLVPLLAPGSSHLLIYHCVIDGCAMVEVEGNSPLRLEPGDIVVFPHGDPHRMTSSDGTLENRQTGEILDRIRTGGLVPLRSGGGGETTRFVCGFMACDPALGKPVLSGLPRRFKVNIRTDPAGRWLESTLLHLVEETAAGSVGSDAMLSKLSEALFVETLRRYIATLPEQQAGWLAGAKDPVVGRALGLLHGRVAHAWTVAELAQQVGVSRSALVERFTKYLAEPPITYLTRWRMQLAARALAQTLRGVAEIAAEVGYDSEAAFNRAFKREFTLPPARYRKQNRTAHGTR
jgi:AraC-like DNA-binding protein